MASEPLLAATLPQHELRLSLWLIRREAAVGYDANQICFCSVLAVEPQQDPVDCVLTLTLTLLSALSIVREVERGTWHGLLTSPAGSTAIVLGKLLTYFILGALLFAALAALSAWQFGTTSGGWALWFAAALFMLANLGLGLTISLLARTQMQAMQMGVFFYLPSILLSGFMFPFHAMPAWARAIGDTLPLTHFLRCLRASLTRGADNWTVLELAWPIALFATLALLVAIRGATKWI
jgi:ABC-2 type transport system permease protein